MGIAKKNLSLTEPPGARDATDRTRGLVVLRVLQQHEAELAAGGDVIPMQAARVVFDSGAACWKMTLQPVATMRLGLSGPLLECLTGKR